MFSTYVDMIYNLAISGAIHLIIGQLAAYYATIKIVVYHMTLHYDYHPTIRSLGSQWP